MGELYRRLGGTHQLLLFDDSIQWVKGRCMCPADQHESGQLQWRCSLASMSGESPLHISGVSYDPWKENGGRDGPPVRIACGFAVQETIADNLRRQVGTLAVKLD